jgi:uncharacterized protein (TIRG00374 family)
VFANNHHSTSPPGNSLKRFPWFRLLLSFVVGGLALWFVSRNLGLAEIRSAFRQADLSFVLLGLVIIGLTIMAKTWRWQFLFVPRQAAPPLSPLFWSLILGQFVNALLPIRLGEVVRIYALNQQARSGKARTFGTLVIEKKLDTVAIIASGLLLLPYVVVPSYVKNQTLTLATATAVIFAFLIFIAFQSQRLVLLISRIAKYLPTSVQQRVIRLFIAGLEGLSALRDWRLTLVVVALTAAIAILSILTPLVLFPAFGLPVSISTAILLNVVLSIGSAPSSTPGKVLIFEGLVTFTLIQLGHTNNAVILSYAIVYHLVVVVPQLVLGTLAMVRSRWRLPVYLANDKM